MEPAVNSRPAAWRADWLLADRQTLRLALLFAALMGAQALCYFVLGTGGVGRGISSFLLDIDSFIALACAGIAFRRARGSSALFWLLFGITLIILLIPNAILTYDSLVGHSTLSDSTWRLLFCLYGAPVMMMLFLPETLRHGQLKWETVLDLVQVGIVVSLVYSVLFFLPVQTMAPGDALLRNLAVSNLHSLFLLIASVVRLQFSRLPGSRRLLSRLVLFLAVCTIATFIGDWIDKHHYVSASAWFDLGWAVPQVVAALVAITWRPAPQPARITEQVGFWRFLTANLVLVAMLVGINLLSDRLKAAHGELLADVAITAMLLAFTFRLALTQFHQQQEITDRKASQKKLMASNQQVSDLLEDARRQTDEITQINELGSLLQACTSPEEVFRLIPERMSRLFPYASGCVALVCPSKNRVEAVAEWGASPPNDKTFGPQECWALRRGCVHDLPPGASASRCSHFAGDGASICLPLIANGEAIGTMAIQNQQDFSEPLTDLVASTTFVRHRQLATAVAEHLAFSIANLQLQEALRLQAIRDPLTGLYNRRYMQEFLDHELHAARRKNRPLSVMMLDLDHFKRYNDTYGHGAGDKALAALGDTLQRCIRADDIACRYGGEEFALILPDCPLAQAILRADDIRKRIAELPARTGESGRPITVSIGVAAYEETTNRVDLLLKFADDALYEAKRAGRNRVMAARPAAGMPDANINPEPQAAPQVSKASAPSS